MEHDIFKFIPGNIKTLLVKFKLETEDRLLEIRLRVNRPVEIITYYNNFFLEGINSKDRPYIVKKDDFKRAMLILTDNSLYAVERQLREGFITVEGGHRIGFTGRAVINDGRIDSIQDINSLNYRLAHEIIGIGEDIINKIYDYKNNRLFNTLLISPPICGKTTLLRDLVRILSDGNSKMGIKGHRVGVVDERSEIGGACRGVPQKNIGKRTDLLDNCPKDEGMMILIRSMSPEVIAVDEVGKMSDVRALTEALTAGVSILTTVHGYNLNSIKLRPALKSLLDNKIFERFIILSKRKGVGTVEKILNSRGEEVG